MARRKKGGGGEGGGGGDWLNTYADMVTLLLTFFILLFSMSSLDAAKFDMIVDAFRSDHASSDQIVIFATGDGTYEDTAQNRGDSDIEESDQPSLEEVAKAIQAYIESQGMAESVEVSNGDDYIFIRFLDEILFLPNSSELRDPNMALLEVVGNSIRMIEDQVKMISVNGHTAAIPDDPDYAVSDRLLSSDRGNRILRFLEDNVGVDSSKLVLVAWGKQQPLANNETEEGRMKNRRVEILISTDNPIADQLENVYEKLMDE